MKKYLPHILIISFVFILAPIVPVASYAGEIETYKQEVEKNPDDADAHYNLGLTYLKSGKYEEAIEKLSETKVKLSVPLIASFIAKQYRQSDIAKACNVPEDHSNKGPLPENHLCS